MRHPFAAALVLLVAAAAGAKPPSWDKAIDGPKRFKVLQSFGDSAVLDQETGLVWERSPSTVTVHWENANYQCLNGTIGGRRGWRLPRIEELGSLLDALYVLPAGHPFLVEASAFWSSTTISGNNGPLANAAYGFIIGSGLTEAAKSVDTIRSWCVRGGTGIEGQ